MSSELSAATRHHPQRALTVGSSNPPHAKELLGQQCAQRASHMMTPLRAIETLLAEQRGIGPVWILQLESQCVQGRHLLGVQLVVQPFVQQYATRDQRLRPSDAELTRKMVIAG